MSNVAKLKKRALEYEQKKQFDKALDTYMQVLDGLGEHVEEADVALYNRVGDLLLRQGNVGSAVDHYERAVDLYTDGGFHNNAIALCNKILRNAPGRSSVYYKLGRISAKKGFTNDAKQNFLEYADRMQRLGQFEEAFRALKEFADLCPDQDDIRLMLADQLVRGDRKAEAIDQLQYLFEKFDAEGRTREAKATLERMKAIDPDHEPKPGVLRPTPKMNDLIFLDVNYDGTGRPRQSPSRQAPPPVESAGKVPAASDVAPPAPPAPPAHHVHAIAEAVVTDASPASTPPEGGDAESLPELAIEPASTMLDTDASDMVDISPIDGLSTGAAFNGSADDAGAGDNAYGIVSHTDAGFITGFEETSLGTTELDTDAIEPMTGIEHTDPLVIEDSGILHSQDAPELLYAPDGLDTNSNDVGGQLPGTDDFPLIDISLDLIDEAPSSSGSELTFIFPDDGATDGWKPAAVTDVNGAPGASESASVEEPRWPDLSEVDLKLEPLLQLPEIVGEPDLADDSAVEPGPAISRLEQRDEPEDDSPSTGPELHFLALGNDDEPVAPALSELSGFEYLDIGIVGPSMADEPATPVPAVDALRASIALDSNDWELQRRLAESLLEEGDREGGLAALESAMLGFERSGDIRGANAVVDEMIRVEPREVRFHQKRVEYAVLAHDSSRLADAYFSLAESLFQMGELDKSRAVYARVVELAPGDARARSALESIGAAGTTESIDALETAQSIDSPETMQSIAEPQNFGEPSTNGTVPAALADELPPVPHAKQQEPDVPAAAAADFVNLSDWLREDEPTRNTRMVVDVKEPEIAEQVDFAEMLTMFKQGVAANVDESDHEAHYDLGVAYKEMGLLDEAISQFQKALRGTERRARTYEALGQCFVEKGQPQIAVTILSRALGDKSYTDDMLVGVLYLLGYASETLGRWADAQRFYERVFAVDIEFRDIGERLASAERGGR